MLFLHLSVTNKVKVKRPPKPPPKNIFYERYLQKISNAQSEEVFLHHQGDPGVFLLILVLVG